MGHRCYAFLTVLFLALAWITWKGDVNRIEASTVTPAAVPKTNSTAKSSSNTSQHANIEYTLNIVSEKWKRTDVNRDGLHNCIDAAVLFYKHYPEKSRVAIIINVNLKTGMNHLFNAVLINGSWISVEPQAYATNHSSYWMKDIWGDQYNNTYNRVATQDYSKYAK